MKYKISVKSFIPNSFFGKAEAVVVLLFLCIGAWTTFSFFSDAHNPNDLSFAGIPKTRGISDNRIVVTGCINNLSGVTLRSFSVTEDAYDEEGKIIGTGTFIPKPGTVLSPSDTLTFEVAMDVLYECRSVKSVMVIPRSRLGTGKILINNINWR